MELVTTELCQKQIKHCHAWIEQGGSLQQFADLQTLKQAPDQQLKADDLAPDVAAPAEEDDEEQEEAGWT